MMATTQTNKDLFRHVFDALDERDLEGVVDTHADNVVLHDHDEEFDGVEATNEHERTLYEAFPDTNLCRTGCIPLLGMPSSALTLVRRTDERCESGESIFR